MTRDYLFNSLPEKLKAGYAESVIDFCVATVFCNWNGSEEELMETSEKLVNMFWSAKEISIYRDGYSPSHYEFETNEFTNSFNTWKVKVEKFVKELIEKRITFGDLKDNGFISPSGYNIIVRK